MNMHNFDIETDDRSYMYERTTYNHKLETKENDKPLSYQEFNMQQSLLSKGV